MTRDDMGKFMKVLTNYSNWRSPKNILIDAYGEGVTDCPAYLDEKLGTLKKGGIIGLWEVLDNVNRNRLLRAIERYAEISEVAFEIKHERSACSDVGGYQYSLKKPWHGVTIPQEEGGE